MKYTTLRPGYLVSLKSSITGNVSYNTRTLEEEQQLADGSARAVWETERVVTDLSEQERAVKVRSKARNLITGICSKSAFGLLCPENAQQKLDEAIAEARRTIADFNAGSLHTVVSLYVIAGRVAADDVEAIRAINSEVRDLVDDMDRGLKALDVQAVREAAKKAQNLGRMLSEDARARIQDAIAAARGAAKQIVKAGEATAVEIDQATLRTLAVSRLAFLDIDEADVENATVEAPQVVGRAIDLDPEDDAEVISPALPRAAAAQIELE